MRAAVLLVLSALAGASAAAPGPQAIFFVNNSIDIPGMDSFIQMDVFSSSPLKVLDSKVFPPYYFRVALSIFNL
jgi:hypothetical protein